MPSEGLVVDSEPILSQRDKAILDACRNQLNTTAKNRLITAMKKAGLETPTPEMLQLILRDKKKPQIPIKLAEILVDEFNSRTKISDTDIGIGFNTDVGVENNDPAPMEPVEPPQQDREVPIQKKSGDRSKNKQQNGTETKEQTIQRIIALANDTGPNGLESIFNREGIIKIVPNVLDEMVGAKLTHGEREEILNRLWNAGIIDGREKFIPVGKREEEVKRREQVRAQRSKNSRTITDDPPVRVDDQIEDQRLEYGKLKPLTSRDILIDPLMGAEEGVSMNRSGVGVLDNVDDDFSLPPRMGSMRSGGSVMASLGTRNQGIDITRNNPTKVERFNMDSETARLNGQDVSSIELETKKGKKDNKTQITNPANKSVEEDFLKSEYVASPSQTEPAFEFIATPNRIEEVKKTNVRGRSESVTSEDRVTRKTRPEDPGDSKTVKKRKKISSVDEETQDPSLVANNESFEKRNSLDEEDEYVKAELDEEPAPVVTAIEGFDLLQSYETPGFADFLLGCPESKKIKHEGTDAETLERIKQRFEVFRIKENLVAKLASFYTTEAGAKIGEAIGGDGIEDAINRYVESEAVGDNPGGLIARMEEVKKFEQAKTELEFVEGYKKNTNGNDDLKEASDIQINEEQTREEARLFLDADLISKYRIFPGSLTIAQIRAWIGKKFGSDLMFNDIKAGKQALREIKDKYGHSSVLDIKDGVQHFIEKNKSAKSKRGNMILKDRKITEEQRASLLANAERVDSLARAMRDAVTQKIVERLSQAFDTDAEVGFTNLDAVQNMFEDASENDGFDYFSSDSVVEVQKQIDSVVCKQLLSTINDILSRDLKIGESGNTSVVFEKFRKLITRKRMGSKKDRDVRDLVFKILDDVRNDSETPDVKKLVLSTMVQRLKNQHK